MKFLLSLFCFILIQVHTINVDYYFFLTKFDEFTGEMYEDPEENKSVELIEYVVDYIQTINELHHHVVKSIKEDFVYEKAPKNIQHIYDQANKVLQSAHPKYVVHIPILKQDMIEEFNWDIAQYEVLEDCVNTSRYSWNRFVHDFTRLKTLIENKNETPHS